MHAPPGYRCPFCAIARGVEEASVLTTQAEVVLRGDDVIAFIAAHQWPNNPGHVLVIPNAHFENLYDLPDWLGAPLHVAARRLALAMKRAYRCHGTSTRQHNEPAGNQDVWHFHQHVFPRYDGDDLYRSEKLRYDDEERACYADRLRVALST